MAWASRMATMAALLTATSGVVLVNDWKPGDKCCISKYAIKDISTLTGCSGVLYSWWRKDPKTCEAVNSNLETYKELQKCVWKHYWKGTAGEEDKIDVVFSGIRTIEAARIRTGAKEEPNVLNNAKPTEDPDYCGKLFKRVYTAAEAKETSNIVAGAAYKTLLIEAVIDATERHIAATEPQMDKMPDLLKDLDKILEMIGLSNDDHIIKRKADVDKLVSSLKEKMGKGDKDETKTGMSVDDIKAMEGNKPQETPNETNPNATVTKEKATTDKSETNSDLDNKANNVDSSKVDTKTGTIAKEVPQNANTEIVTMKDEVPERDQKQKHGCMHRIKRALGLTAKTFARAIRHQLHALQE